jgi:hypothetical protein
MPVIFLAIPGIISSFKRENTSGISNLLVAWFVCGLILCYIPVPLQRRFLLGLFIPTTMLAIYFLDQSQSPINNRRKGILTALIILSYPGTLLQLVLSGFGILSRNENYYISNCDKQLLTIANERNITHEVVLSSPEMGLYIPGMTGAAVIYGHPFETPHASFMKQEVMNFWESTNKVFQREFLQAHNVNFVYYGNRESEISSGVLPTNLEPIFQCNDSILYQVD